MKLNNKILSSAAAVLAAVSLGLITSQTVNAQSITLHKGYDKTATPYIRQKGEFIHANKSIKIKNYKFYGQPILTKGDKVVYASATTPRLINQEPYYYIGNGGYVKQNNAYVMKGGTYVLTRNSYVYDKNGNRLKTYRGKRAYLPYNTKIKSPNGEEYYRKPYTYYNIGKNIYIQSDQIAKLNGKGVLFVSQNSSVYNSRGQRQRQVIKAGRLVPYAGKVQDKGSQYFYVANNKNHTVRSLKSYKIKGNYYFRIGKNQYIKANNVNAINGNALYTKGPIKVKIVADTLAYNQDFQQINKLYKKGQTVTADMVVQTGMGDYTASYYRVKGGKNPVYIDTGLYEESSPDVPYVWSGDNGPTLAKQYLSGEDAYNMRYSVADFKIGQTAFYNVNGEKVDTKFDGDELAINQKLYLWDAKENKAELYYHVQNSLIYKSGAEDDRQNTAYSNLYVKASDVALSGRKLKTSNTEAEAKAASALATASEKTSLTNAISDESTVKTSDKYRLDNWVNRSLYDQAIENAKTVAVDKDATKAAVNEALWQVNFAKKNLKGAKVKVKDINNLTPLEAQQVLNLMRQAYNSDKPYPMVSVYQKWAHKPGYYPAEGWKGNQKTRYYLIPSSGAKKVLLKFSDFATEK